MDYITAVEQALKDLANDIPCDGVAMQAALALAIAASSTDGIDEDAWTRVLLELLDVTFGLYPHPLPVVLQVEPDASPTSRQASVVLIRSIAQRFERGAADETADGSRRLQWAAGGIRLTAAVQGMS